jgi:hypothetical protein
MAFAAPTTKEDRRAGGAAAEAGGVQGLTDVSGEQRRHGNTTMMFGGAHLKNGPAQAGPS